MGEKGVWGKDTIEKQNDFRAMLAHHINVCKKIYDKQYWNNNPYVYIDCFGGPGIYGDNNEIKGSPVIFDELCAKLGNMGYTRYIFEENKKRYNSLIQHIGNHNVFNTDCKTIFDRTNMAKRKWQYGLVYIDSELDVSGMYDLGIDLIKHISSYYQTLDIMIYISSTTLKRPRSVHKHNRWITDIIKYGKPHWAIRELKGKNQYTFLIGTNYKSWVEWQKIGFHLISSKKGKSILDNANYTKKEYKKKVQLSFLSTIPMLNTLHIRNTRKSDKRP